MSIVLPAGADEATDATRLANIAADPAWLSLKEAATSIQDDQVKDGSIPDATRHADARAHVEEAGTQIHHAHDEALCSACTVRHLLASSSVLPPDEIQIVHRAQAGAVDRTEALRAVASSTTRSRAPPAQI